MIYQSSISNKRNDCHFIWKQISLSLTSIQSKSVEYLAKRVEDEVEDEEARNQATEFDNIQEAVVTWVNLKGIDKPFSFVCNWS